MTTKDLLVRFLNIALTIRKLFNASTIRLDHILLTRNYPESKTINIGELKICLNGIDCNANEDCVLGSTCAVSIDPSARKSCVYDDNFDLLTSNKTCAIWNQECNPGNGCCNPSLSCSSTSNTCIPMVPPACVLSRIDSKKSLTTNVLLL